MRRLLLVLLTLLIARPLAAAPQDALVLPHGFSASVFASGLGKVRLLAVHPKTGVLFASVTDADEVIALPDANHDGKADRVVVFASGIPKAHGLTWHDGFLYVAGTDRVVRVRDDNNDLVADAKAQTVGKLPSGGGHFTRTIRFGPDGTAFISIGSSCNVCLEENSERATIIAISADGKSRRIYASGLRNAVGITFDASGRLWATCNGRDLLGNELPPEPLYQVVDGGFYGWPYAYGNGIADPTFGATRPDLVAKTLPPAWEFSAHIAPLGLNFYTGDKWPKEYQGDLFIAFHGSWNSTYKKGYKVMRVHFANGQPVSASDFVTGFLQPDEKVWGRPVDIITGSDGQMYLTDDFGGRVFRVSHG